MKIINSFLSVVAILGLISIYTKQELLERGISDLQSKIEMMVPNGEEKFIESSLRHQNWSETEAMMTEFSSELKRVQSAIKQVQSDYDSIKADRIKMENSENIALVNEDISISPVPTEQMVDTEHEMRLAEIESAFILEEPDNVKTYMISDILSKQLTDLNRTNSYLHSVDCRETLCLVRSDHGNVDDFNSFMQQVSFSLDGISSIDVRPEIFNGEVYAEVFIRTN